MIRFDADKREALRQAKARIAEIMEPSRKQAKDARKAQRKATATARAAFPGKSDRQPRVRDNAYLAFLRRCRCLNCNAPAPCDAAHIRWAPPGSGWRYVGKAEKPNDARAIPLCRSCHTLQHSMSERRFWEDILGYDPVEQCALHYERFMAQSSKASQTSVASVGGSDTCEARERPNTNTTTSKG